MIDEGETDWKIIAIRADHALAGKLHGEADIEAHFPGCLVRNFHLSG